MYYQENEEENNLLVCISTHNLIKHEGEKKAK